MTTDFPDSQSGPVAEAPTNGTGAEIDPVAQARAAFVHDLTAVEVRVVGCLVEKESTTPDNYPLSTNSLTSACNQKTSRDPVMDLKAADVDAALLSLRERKMVRAVHVQGSRATKHRHVFEEAAAVSKGELALLSVLFLRSAQTVGELRSRSERIHDFSSTSEVEDVMRGLAARGAVRELPRQPGQSATRWEHLAGSDLADTTSSSAPVDETPIASAPSSAATSVSPDGRAAASDAPSTSDPVDMQRQLSELSARFEALEGRFDSLADQLGDLLGEPPQ